MKVDQPSEGRFHVSRRELAELFGVTLRAVNGWTLTPIARKGRTELYELRDVIAERIEKTSPRTAELTRERALLARAQREKADLDLAQRRGELVSVTDVVQCWGEMAGAMRARSLLIPGMAAPLVVGKTTAEAEAAIRKLVYEALAELADDGVPS